MTDPSVSPTPDDHEPSHDPSGGDPAKAGGATAILDSLRDAFDDLAERATPAVREVSARAAELTAVAAAKAAPLAKKAGEATAEASDKLAERSKTWAAGVRAAMDVDPAPDAAGSTTWGDASPATDTPPAENGHGAVESNGNAPSADASAGDTPTTEH